MYRVFLVDDEPFIIEGLQTILEWNDYGLSVAGTAENGEDAWEKLQQQPVDLIITDIMMPRMTGLQLIEKVKEAHPQTRFIILSGYNEFMYVKEGIKLGVENYLLKPINIEEFRSTLETTVQKIDQSRVHRMAEQHNRDILRDNVLYRWLRDLIHLEELQQRADLLDIHFIHPYYMVVLVRPEPQMDHEADYDKQEEVVSHARRLLKQANGGFCVPEWDGETAIIFGLYRSGDKEELMGRLREWKREVEGMLSTSLQITLGSVQEGYAHASASYLHAKRVQPYHLVRADDEWVDADEIADYRSSRPADVQPETEPYVKLLYDRDKEQLRKQLEADFEQLSATIGVTPRDIRNFAVELLIAWKQSVKDTAHYLLEEERDWFDEVYHIQTLEVLKDHVLQVGYRIMGQLAEPEHMSPVIKQVLHDIQGRYAEELSLKTLSQVYNINPVYLGQLFQKEVQSTFSDYLNKTRIKMAKEMLVNTNQRMTDIASNVGYWDKSYFYKQFRKYVGVSPKEYREFHANRNEIV
ncbi:response regulator transcription factor [Paenibacillus thiaminolyticus]|uniref:Response regulator transcription factor n=1 Tax=Paenibacillus thiaminolyticus TaxID=49283 RepID=A0AAP9DUQ2_PANTH|nr:response regulator transcription factor [Paenibacillus thiaminolyticus]MCY9534749.1 response regulator transcription factor [Paenibacillus thiaminolyticus]MCY9602082.1 response regulator transcription factor [Paenibacillus thiaminolyticus]MCY9608860.1 response regulator transcription factor [Paenibacillus thiaminolyticus]MCY9614914.1 response regulator transcription factor [Paenibacillus thiaminolyticus]MCY9618456.1 response regulator transcription factor [Paenibacillus thiaminolyticus]